MQKLLIYTILMATFLIGCSPAKLEIQQGNIITADMLAKVEVGMTTSQVRFLLGSPQLVDPFRSNRWDYVYSLRQDGKETKYKHLILFFEGDILSKIEERDRTDDR